MTHRIGRRLHYRHAASCRRRTWDRYQRKSPDKIRWLPSRETYQRMSAIGWYPNGYCNKPCI